MKRAVDLLGLDRRLVQEQNRDVEYLLTEAQLELVAKRAREEMLIDAMAVVIGIIRAHDADPDDIPILKAVVKQLRALPVEAAK